MRVAHPPQLPTWTEYIQPRIFPEVSAYFGKADGDRRINDANDLAMYLLEVGHVATVSGDAFCAPGYIRLSYATSDDNIREAARRIAQTLARLK